MKPPGGWGAHEFSFEISWCTHVPAQHPKAGGRAPIHLHPANHAIKHISPATAHGPHCPGVPVWLLYRLTGPATAAHDGTGAGKQLIEAVMAIFAGNARQQLLCELVGLCTAMPTTNATTVPLPWCRCQQQLKYSRLHVPGQVAPAHAGAAGSSWAARLGRHCALPAERRGQHGIKAWQQNDHSL